VYALTRLGAFSGADFYSLFDEETEVLGADFAALDELTLRPSESYSFTRVLDAGVTSIGVVVAYRDIDGSRWRAWTPVVQGQDNTLHVVVGADAVSIGSVQEVPSGAAAGVEE
jgi:type VI secretion system protein VasD